VPLWVAHENDGPANPSNANAGESTTGSYNGISSTSKQQKSELTRAKQSLLLLEEPGAQSATSASAATQPTPSVLTKKCAMYSIDFHPSGSRFATGGGDGKVRLWNSNELFRMHSSASTTRSKAASPTTLASNKEAVLAFGNQSRYSDDGKYFSGSSSGGEESSSSMDSSLEDTDNHISDSSSHSRSDSGIRNRAKTPQLPEVREEDQIHDLTSFVRHKKKKTTSTTPKNPADKNNQSASPPATSQTQANHHRQSFASTPIHGNDASQLRHRLLCTMSAHTGSSVLAVRFSTSGKFLASAGDDSVVCIYTKTASSSPAAGNMGDSGHHVEQWKRIKLCRGHALDVVGLAWAPDDSHLVSCSLDSNTPIIVWKLTDLASQMQRVTHDNILCSPYKILGSGTHSSTVKGVTFDPAGTYLASSGDDPCVCVWRAHDDWGLEKRLDASSGIFRQWGHDNSQGLSSQTLFRRLSWSTDGSYICSTNAMVKNKHVASTISRDGWGVSGSNSSASGAANLVGHRQPVVASRHCPHLIDTRTNHSMDEDGPSGEDAPEYATLVALGDRRGFLTVWSTKKSRPIFKLQCSENRSTITDLAWGQPDGNGLVLAVSLLDGQVVALRFNVPHEVGRLLDEAEKGRIFELRYGINPVESLRGSGIGGRRLFVGESAAPRLIENAFQMAMETTSATDGDGDNDHDMEIDGLYPSSNPAQLSANMPTDNPIGGVSKSPKITPRQVEATQQVSKSQSGKKRIRPVLIGTDEDVVDAGNPDRPQRQQQNQAGKGLPETANDDDSVSKRTSQDSSLHAAINAAKTAATNAEAVAENSSTKISSSSGRRTADTKTATTGTAASSTAQRHANTAAGMAAPSASGIGNGIHRAFTTAHLPISTNRIHSVELPVRTDGGIASRVVGDCTNSSHPIAGAAISSSSGGGRGGVGKATTAAGDTFSCVTVSVAKDGKMHWKDKMIGTSCCAVAASHDFLAVGTSDGSVQLYGTSPSNGWASGSAFRSHPPFVYSAPILSIQLKCVKVMDGTEEHSMAYDRNRHQAAKDSTRTHMLVVTADGGFVIHQILPTLILVRKGSILPPINHMSASTSGGRVVDPKQLPKVARIQITDTNRLLLLLSLPTGSRKVGNIEASRHRGGGDASQNETMKSAPSASAVQGGSVQAFVYLQDAEMWVRIADGRFLLSDFYSAIPRRVDGDQSLGELACYEDAARMGSANSAATAWRGMKRGRKDRNRRDNSAAPEYSQMLDGSLADYVTRSHCEDRMACAVCLQSKSEFKHWLTLYCRILAMGGQETQIRIVADMLLGRTSQNEVGDDAGANIAGNSSNSAAASRSGSGGLCWWLDSAPGVLGLDRASLIRTAVIKEVSRNRLLQRLTQEISIDLQLLE